MPKLKISAVIPPLHQPANSLYPTVQTDKERRFLLTVKPASSVGSLYEEIYDKCKNAYLDGRQASDFFIVKLQDEHQNDLTKDLILGDIFDEDSKAIHIVQVIKGDAQRYSSIPHGTALRPAGFSQKRPFEGEGPSHKRRRLDELDEEIYANADPDRPWKSAERASSESDEEREVADLEIEDAVLQVGPGSSTNDLDNEAAVPATVPESFTNDGFRKPDLPGGSKRAAPPPKSGPPIDMGNHLRVQQSDWRPSSPRDAPVQKKPAARALSEFRHARNTCNVFEVPATDTELSEGSPEKRRFRTEPARAPVPDIFTQIPSQLTPTIDSESSQERAPPVDRSMTTNVDVADQVRSRDRSVTTSSKALERVRAYRRARDETSDLEKRPTPSRYVADTKRSNGKSSSRAPLSQEPHDVDPIESSSSEILNRSSKARVPRTRKPNVKTKIKDTAAQPIQPDASPRLSAPSKSAHASRESSRRRMSPASQEIEMDGGREADATSIMDEDVVVAASSPHNDAGYAASKKLSSQAMKEENVRRHFEDRQSPRAIRERCESEKKAARYFQQVSELRHQESPSKPRPRAAPTNGDSRPSSRRSAPTSSDIVEAGSASRKKPTLIPATNVEEDTERYRPSQDLTPMSEPVKPKAGGKIVSARTRTPQTKNSKAAADFKARADSYSGVLPPINVSSMNYDDRNIPSSAHETPVVVIPPRAVEVDNAVYGIKGVLRPTKIKNSSRRKAPNDHASQLHPARLASEDIVLKTNDPVQGSSRSAEADRSSSSKRPSSPIHNATPGPSNSAKFGALATERGATSAPGKLKQLSSRAKEDLKQGRLPFASENAKGKQRARLGMKMQEPSNDGEAHLTLLPVGQPNGKLGANRTTQALPTDETESNPTLTSEKASGESKAGPSQTITEPNGVGQSKFDHHVNGFNVNVAATGKSNTGTKTKEMPKRRSSSNAIVISSGSDHQGDSSDSEIEPPTIEHPSARLARLSWMVPPELAKILVEKGSHGFAMDPAQHSLRKDSTVPAEQRSLRKDSTISSEQRSLRKDSTVSSEQRSLRKDSIVPSAQRSLWKDSTVSAGRPLTASSREDDDLNNRMSIDSERAPARFSPADQRKPKRDLTPKSSSSSSPGAEVEDMDVSSSSADKEEKAETHANSSGSAVTSTPAENSVSFSDYGMLDKDDVQKSARGAHEQSKAEADSDVSMSDESASPEAQPKTGRDQVLAQNGAKDVKSPTRSPSKAISSPPPSPQFKPKGRSVDRATLPPRTTSLQAPSLYSTNSTTQSAQKTSTPSQSIRSPTPQTNRKATKSSPNTNTTAPAPIQAPSPAKPNFTKIYTKPSPATTTPKPTTTRKPPPPTKTAASTTKPRPRSASTTSASSASSSASSLSSHDSDAADTQLQSDLSAVNASLPKTPTTASDFAKGRSIAARARQLTTCMYHPFASFFGGERGEGEKAEAEGETGKKEKEKEKEWWDVPASPSPSPEPEDSFSDAASASASASAAQTDNEEESDGEPHP